MSEVTPTGSDIYRAIGFFAESVLNDVEAFQGQVNKVPEPRSQNFVIMTEIRRIRIATNGLLYQDAVFTASIAGAVMAVSDVGAGVIRVGATVFGEGVPSGASIVEQLSGSVGGTGAYSLTATGTVGSSTLSAGQITVTGAFEVAVQLDVHGPNASANTAILSTLMRDPRGVAIFEASGAAVVPLHADDGRQMPFENAEKQWETRYVLEALVQVNEVVTGLSQEYASTLELQIVSVEAAFPG